MDNTQFDALVRRLETQERANPAVYGARVVLLALLAYAYIGIVLLALLGLVALSVVLMTVGAAAAFAKLSIALLVAAWFILRALWVRFDPPEGRALTRREAPKLFEEADAIARAIRAPRADVVLLNQEYNASVDQIPRLGILGFPRNYLSIGMPLLASLSSERIRAVLAHEFAHLSHAHGKFGAWCYRIEMTWHQLLTALEKKKHWSSGIFRPFFNWYVPYFAAYTFVLRRRHELEADLLSADIVGRRAAAQTLVDIRVRRAFLANVFWPEVWSDADDKPTPSDDVYARLANTTQTQLDLGVAKEWLAAELEQATETNDTHPSLGDRLRHLVPEELSLLSPSTSFADSAMITFLAPLSQVLAREFGASWRASASGNWTRQYEAIRAAREGVAALESRSPEMLSQEERFQLAGWTEDLEGSEAGLQLYESLLRDDPVFAWAAYAAGRIRASRGDEAGIALLERAMQSDTEAIIPACRLATEFYQREGRLDDAARYRERARHRQVVLEEARAERRTIAHKDRFLPSDLPSDEAAPILAQLDAIAEVRFAFLARKEVEHFAAESPMHVLAVQVGSPILRFRSLDSQREMTERVGRSIEVPESMHLFVLTSKHSKLLRPIRKVAGALIYQASRRKEERRLAQAR